MKKNFTNYFSRLFTLALSISIAFQGLAQNEIPDGYYDKADGLAGKELKTALFNIIKVGKRLTYGSGPGKTWSGFEKTDKHPDGYVWDMYSYNKRYFPGNGGVAGGMNIEHSVAKSWWGGTNNDAYKDLYHLNPSDVAANSARSNYPLGIVKNGKTEGSLKIGSNSYGTEYNGNSFEPLDIYKGDFARAYLYMFTCYENLTWTKTSAPSMIVANQTYPMLRPWAAKMLVEWSEMDPPSEKEMNRAAEIYKIQNNRNPFIDYPELVDYLWGDKVGEAFYFTVNTDPKIVAPSNNASFTMPETHYTAQSTLKLTIKAKNMSEPLWISIDGENKNLFSLSDSYINPLNGDIEKEISIVYHPVKAETTSVSLIISSKTDEVKTRTVTINAVSTEDFYTLQPEKITSSSFTARWTPISTSNVFELDVYQKEISGEAEVVLNEVDFQDKLEGGWKSVEGYTDFYEKGSVRLASSSKSGKISSPKLDLSKPGKIIVFAKAFKDDKNVVLTVKIDEKVIDEISLTGDFDDYMIDFDAEGAESAITFSAVANKRLHISSVKISTQGQTVEKVREQGYPKTINNATSFEVSNLKEETDYYYTVLPLNSDWTESDEIHVRTLDSGTDVKINESDNIKIYSANKTFIISGLNKDDKISVFNIAGNIVKDITANSFEERVEIEETGIYIIKVENSDNSTSYKVPLYN